LVLSDLCHSQIQLQCVLISDWASPHLPFSTCPVFS
jgi:hypothetical protein